MGGTALGRQAQPLTTVQFQRLAVYCTSKLDGLFSDIRVEFCPRDKLVHGDVDLLCGWSGHIVGVHIGGYDRSDDDKGTNAVLRALATEISDRIGGTKWVRKSGQVNVAVPCRVIGVKGDHEDVDVNLLPPPSLDLSLLLMSYRSNIVILPRAVAKISPSLRLESTRLLLRHTIQPGQPAVEVTLTTSAREICDWIGLDWAKFGVFDTEAGLYRWFTDVSPGYLLGKVWQKVLRGEDMPKKYGVGHATRKTEGWDMLADWIRANYQSPSNAPHAGLDAVSAGSVSQTSSGGVRLDPDASLALQRWGKGEEYQEKVGKRIAGRRM